MGNITAKRMMIAALKSGSGKTTITCGLLALLKQKGLDPVSFKCGPDYIDPMFHKKVLSVDSRNLDTFFSGTDGVRESLENMGDRYALIEGVMGMYDGMSPEGIEGSCYEIALATETPILLVIDAAGAGRSILAMIAGALSYDTGKLIRGVLLNRVSEHFYRSVEPVVVKELERLRPDVKLCGFFPKGESFSFESRHLGLQLPEEVEDIRERLGGVAEQLEVSADLPAILGIMEEAPKTAGPESKSMLTSSEGEGLSLAVAYDDAFCFYYRENLELFERAGVTLRFFSPLCDSRIPEDADALLLGGGYPELHLQQLAGNTSMLASVREAVERGIPSLAECGGFMYLHRLVADKEGKEYELVGAIDGKCSYTGRLVRFGYLEIDECHEDAFAQDPLFGALVGMKGHEFHYFDSTVNGDSFRARKPQKDLTWDCMIARGRSLWGFPHFNYPSKPEFVESFISAMRAFHTQRYDPH